MTIRPTLTVMVGLSALFALAGGCKDKPGGGGGGGGGGQGGNTKVGAPPARSAWPKAWKVERKASFTAAQLASFNKRFGGAVKAVDNYFLIKPVRGAAGAVRQTVNVISLPSPASARTLLSRMAKTFQTRLRFALRGSELLEFVGTSALRTHHFKSAMGLLDRSTRRYRMTARLGLVQKGDAAVVNEVFNLALRPRPQDPGWKLQLATRVATLTWGKELALRGAPTAAGKTRYSFEPASTSNESDGPRQVYSFDVQPDAHGLRAVQVIAEVVTAGFTPIPGPVPKAPLYTEPTRHWPVGDAKLIKLAEGLVTGAKTDRERVERLRGWMTKNLSYGGARLGARKPVAAVLKSGRGRCWELTDVFITLARAAGLPARQVAGWVDGLEGHIWAEVYLRGEGWIGVDSTLPWLGISGDYLPLMTTVDSELIIQHLARPRIERLQ